MHVTGTASAEAKMTYAATTTLNCIRAAAPCHDGYAPRPTHGDRHDPRI
jgi:hypothetical protein